MCCLRRWLKAMSLAAKLTTIGVVASFVSLVVACVLIMAYDASSSRARLVSDAQLLADVVAANSTATLAFGDATGAHETLSTTSVDRRVVSATILLPSGAVFAEYRRDPSPSIDAVAMSDPSVLRSGTPWQTARSRSVDRCGGDVRPECPPFRNTLADLYRQPVVRAPSHRPER